MGATAQKIVDQFIGMAAKKHPDDRPEVYRRAAYTFMGLAQDPKNVRSAGNLAQIGLGFADAATRERPAVMDDFTNLLRETEQAYNEVGDEPMDAIARGRENHDAQTPRTPGFTSIAPESFNKDATLGRSAMIKFAPTQEEISVEGILQAQNVAFWQGVKKEAQAMTVDASLGFLPPFPMTFGDAGALSSVRAYVEVEYGSDGNRTKVLSDLAFGKRFTVVGNYIAVTIGCDPPMKDGAGVPHPTVPITVGASIGAFAAPSNGDLIRTGYIDHLTFVGPGVSELIPVPLKAVALLPIQTTLALGGTAQIDFFSYGGNIISAVFYQQAINSTMQPVPLTGDVAFVRISNTGANTANFRLPFQLAM